MNKILDVNGIGRSREKRFVSRIMYLRCLKLVKATRMSCALGYYRTIFTQAYRKANYSTKRICFLFIYKKRRECRIESQAHIPSSVKLVTYSIFVWHLLDTLINNTNLHSIIPVSRHGIYEYNVDMFLYPSVHLSDCPPANKLQFLKGFQFKDIILTAPFFSFISTSTFYLKQISLSTWVFSLKKKLIFLINLQKYKIFGWRNSFSAIAV